MYPTYISSIVSTNINIRCTFVCSHIWCYVQLQWSITISCNQNYVPSLSYEEFFCFVTSSMPGRRSMIRHPPTLSPWWPRGMRTWTDWRSWSYSDVWGQTRLGFIPPILTGSSQILINFEYWFATINITKR